MSPPEESKPEIVGRARDCLVPDSLQGADRGHVQGVLKRLADEDGTTVQLVAVVRRPVLSDVELGRDVEEKAAGRQSLVVEGARVLDRLERGTRLAQAVARRVVLRGELALARSSREYPALPM